MALSRRTYHFRFLSNKENVFYVGKKPNPKNPTPNDITVYTEPFVSKERAEVTNALVGYRYKQRAEQMVEKLSQQQGGQDCLVLEDELQSLKYLSKIIQLPLIVEMDRFKDEETGVEIVNVFYFSASGKNLKDFFETGYIKESDG